MKIGVALLSRRRWPLVGLSCLLVAAFFLLHVAPSAADSPDAMRERLRQRELADQMANEALPAMGMTPCVDGFAGSYPCDQVDLMAFVPLADMGAGGAISASSLWGWTDPDTGREYALVGLENATAFVDITNAAAPVYLGRLPTHTGVAIWRELKVYANHAFIVADGNGNHGIQVFDLTQLRDVASPPVTFDETAHYDEVANVHNMVINEESGFGYAVGSNTCSGGLHMVDLRDPLNPTFAGCFSQDGYTHDAQCLTYDGPDADYTGREICIASNEDTITVVDVTDKSNPIRVARRGYTGAAYTHQSWLTGDRSYMVVDDELDEVSFGHNARTYIWDMRDLDAPTVIGAYTSASPAIDHNQYIKGDYNFQANYRAGLRVLDIREIASGTLTEVGFFDIYPQNDAPSFNAAWNVYPFFESGNVIVSGIEQGLFVLRPILEVPTAVTVAETGSAAPSTAPLVAALALLGLAGAGWLWRRRA